MQLKVRLYLTCSDQKGLKGRRAAAPFSLLTGHAREALRRVDVKCLRVGLGEDGRNVVMDLNSAVFGRG